LCWEEGEECCFDCIDEDSDGHGIGVDCERWDCNDEDPECYTVGSACCDLTCIDNDGDGFGMGTCRGVDCNEEDSLCWEIGEDCCAAGGASCAETMTCVNACSGEMNCFQDCFEAASTEAQLLFRDVHDCGRSRNCSPTNPMCFRLYCRLQIAACNGE
jgi:hypothetical protein